MQTPIKEILKKLEACAFAVETDTRRNVSGKVFFALKGDNFDGSDFVEKALAEGALCAVTENINLASNKVYVVGDVLETLQECAKIYRQKFNIPILAIGGSNGKTTTRELVERVLSTKYRTHSSEENLNNHIGVPISILKMPKTAEIGIFEVGANHPGEHSGLMEILHPTMVLVTNNGLDHLEGFGSPEGVRRANKEIYDWARENGAKAFVNKNHEDLAADSLGIEVVTYPQGEPTIVGVSPLKFVLDGLECQTQLAGDYNIENILSAVEVGKFFGVDVNEIFTSVASYEPNMKRSQILSLKGMDLILDCYNANPSSMLLALKSFAKSSNHPKGVVLGEMLELGHYAEGEHKKIVDFVIATDIEKVILVGNLYNDFAPESSEKVLWFPSVEEASLWFLKQDFSGYSFLLKGSRGSKIEKILNL